MADILKYFQLKERPFSLLPTPRFFYLSKPYLETKAKLTYFLKDQTASLYLVGDIGVGKTTLIRLVNSEISGNKDIIARYLSASSNLGTPNQLLRALCEEFGVKTDRNQQNTQKYLRDYLIEQAKEGKMLLALIDEAQHLSAPQLRLVHDFLNFVSNERVLIMFILVGQPLLAIKIKRNRSLKSRMMSAKLTPMSEKELQAMVKYRWTVAGGKTPPFTPGAYKTIHKLSGGVPREAVKLCNNSLLLTMLKNQKRVDSDCIKSAGEIL